MTRRIVLSKVVAGVAIAGALTLTSAFSGVVFAGEAINIGVGELQECTISKSMDADAGTDGPELFIWQKAPSQSSEGVTEEVAFYYNRIAFNYAASK